MYCVSLALVPLPQFSTYIALTILSLLSSSYHVWINDIKLNLLNANHTIDLNLVNLKYQSKIFYSSCLNNYWCLWSVVNFAYACLLFVGLIIQNTCFGEIRQDEHINLREKFWNFLFYKLIFIYGILNIQNIHELLLWAAWSSVLGFLHLLTGLVKDRLEFIVQSNNIKPSVHLKLIILLSAIIIVANALSFVSFIVGLSVSFNLMFFMLAEVVNLFISTSSVISRYAIHFFIEAEANNPNGHPRSFQNVLLHYSGMIFSFISNIVEFTHYVHMLLWSQTFINMTTLVLLMQLQYIYSDMHSKYCVHQRYVSIAKYLSQLKFVKRPKVNCPICWESMSKGARSLTCGHELHDACLREWLQQNSNCPICRRVLDNSWDSVKPNIGNSEIPNESQTFTDTAPVEEANTEAGNQRAMTSEATQLNNSNADSSEEDVESLELVCSNIRQNPVKMDKVVKEISMKMGDASSSRASNHSNDNVNYDLLLFHNVLLNELSSGRIATRNGRRNCPPPPSSASGDPEDTIASLKNILDSAIGDKGEIVARVKALSERFKIDIEDILRSFNGRGSGESDCDLEENNTSASSSSMSSS